MADLGIFLWVRNYHLVWGDQLDALEATPNQERDSWITNPRLDKAERPIRISPPNPPDKAKNKSGPQTSGLFVGQALARVCSAHEDTMVFACNFKLLSPMESV